MFSRHSVYTSDQAAFEIPSAFAALSNGFRRWSIVNGETGSVHQEFNICELDPAGSIETHVHSFEESMYVLEGQLTCETGDGSFVLGEGDYGIIQVAAPHAFRNTNSQRVRWAEMLAPQPRLGSSGDTFAVTPLPFSESPLPIDARDPRIRSFGRITRENMDVSKQTQDMLAVSASMRTALLVYSGITVKMMVDGDLGARLLTMFMVQYQPNGMAGAHDHPFEETYMILEGEVDARFDGQRYRLKPGDVAFAGVGCIHEFSNPSDVPVRWLETQAPQPPSRYSYRFARDWTYLEDTLHQEEHSHG
jgi:mannose-6-phosphate isomerase-like protein (cupin superfamily)